MNKEFDGWENMDWNIEIDTLEFDLMAIKSHNKSNPDVGKRWTEWPKDMIGLMLLPLGYQPSKWDKESPLTGKEESDLKQKWIDFAQFVYENESISLKENTFTIDGKDFEVSLDFVDANSAKFTVNGEATRDLLDGETDKLSDGTTIGVSEILYQDYAGGVHQAQFFLGAQKLEMKDTNISQKGRGSVNLKVDDDTIDAYIALKMEEVQAFQANTHPLEFEMYYSL